MLKKEIKKTSPEAQDNLTESNFAFGKLNYSLMLAGVVLLVLGYILMIGGGSKDPNVFSQEIFSFQRMTLAPILIIAGFVVEVFAIMWKVKD
ncbi:MAG: DUF3098 domain-containing protein [Bacteroidales bacterium]|jgi:fumarate reductase subunit D|nr:DUF3098 domain-containing protein [Bacteroidales bacterium]